MALCRSECVNLLSNAIKILGIHFSYSNKLENEKNFFDQISIFKKVMNIWKMQSL